MASRKTEKLPGVSKKFDPDLETGRIRRIHHHKFEVDVVVRGGGEIVDAERQRVADGVGVFGVAGQETEGLAPVKLGQGLLAFGAVGELVGEVELPQPVGGGPLRFGLIKPTPFMKLLSARYEGEGHQ